MFFPAKLQAYNIEVKVENSPNTKLLLAAYQGFRTFVIDTAYTDDTFSAIFSAKKELPEGMYVIVFPDNSSLDLLISTDQYISVYTQYPVNVQHTEISGAQQSITFLNWQKEKLRFDENAKILVAQKKLNNDSISLIISREEFKHKHFLDSLIQISDNNFCHNLLLLYKEAEYKEVKPISAEEFRKKHQFWIDHYFDYTKLTDNRLTQTPVLAEKVQYFFSKLLVRQKDTLVSKAEALVAQTSGDMRKFLISNILQSIQTNGVKANDAAYVYLADKWLLNKVPDNTRDAYLIGVKQRCDRLRNTLEGAQAPDLQLVTQKGENKRLYDIKAPYLALFFWDIDCASCQREANVLDSISKKYAGNGLVVVGIYRFADRKKWVDYTNEKDYAWVHLHDPAHVSNYESKYNISTYPTIFLLDKDKKIIASDIKASDISKWIK
jgi:thiol-disulfide isomerase/thioredoxin